MCEANMPFLRSIKLSGLLSFPPESAPIELTALNVLIGPNASGKSNLIEAIELLHSTPTAFAAAIRDGGGSREWLWKGHGDHRNASVDDVYFYYRFQQGRPVLNTRQTTTFTTTATTTTTTTTTTPPPSYHVDAPRVQRQLTRESLVPDESVLSQRKDPDLYPELTWLGRQFSRIQMFREWSFGRYAALRQPQPADLPTDVLLPDSRNLGLVLTQLPQFGGKIGRFSGFMWS